MNKRVAFYCICGMNRLPFEMDFLATFRIVCTWLHSRELKWFDCIGIGSQTNGSDHTCAIYTIRLFFSAPLSSFNTLAHCIRACIRVTSLFRSTCQFYMRRALSRFSKFSTKNIRTKQPTMKLNSHSHYVYIQIES